MTNNIYINCGDTVSKIKPLLYFLWRAGLKKEAFQVGEISRTTEDFMLMDIAKNSHKILDLILDELLSGLNTLEVIFSSLEKKASSDADPSEEREEEAGSTGFLGPMKGEEAAEKLLKNDYAGRKWHLWYAEFVSLMEDELGIMRSEEAYRIFSGVLAATSVQTKPTYNLVVTMEYLYRWVKVDSMAAWKEYLDITSGRALTGPDREARKVEKRKRLEEMGLFGGGERDFYGHGIKSVDENIERIFSGKEIKGPKVSEFDKALRGDPEAIAVDRHVARVMLGIDSPSSKGDFSTAMSRVRDAAEKLGITPAEAQSAIWCMNIFLTGEKIDDYLVIIRSNKEKIRDLLRRSEELYNRLKDQNSGNI